MGIIASITVDRVELGNIRAKPWLSVHFNCFDLAGAPLPGLGGYVTLDVASQRPKWRLGADALVTTMQDRAREWIVRTDDYSEPDSLYEIIAIQCECYPANMGGGQGFHVRFLRAGDPFEASILFENRPQWGTYMRNQKVRVPDDLAPDIDATIEAIMGQAYDLAWLVNSERDVKKRKGATW